MSSTPLLLFDLDGTLVDTRGDIADSANHVRIAAGLAPLDESTVLGFVGNGSRNLMERCLEGTGVDPEEGTRAFERHYATRPCERSRLYPGIEELLARTEHCGRAVVTNKPLRIALLVLEALGIGGRFRWVIGGRSLARLKPAPDPVDLAVRAMGGAPDRTWMIGDGPQDVRAGQAAGVRTVAVAWGFHDAARLADLGPEILVHDPLEIVPLTDSAAS